MSRYYEIAIDGGPTYSSLSNGLPNPGALNIEMDVMLQGANVVTGNSYVRIWGIPLTDVAQAKDLFGKKITVSAGMKQGLPLAVESQSGLLFQGTIFQAFGNWQGLDQTLELLIVPAAPTQDKPGNFSFTWKKGASLNTAIATTLTSALPSFKQSINISPKLVYSEDVVGVYDTLTQFASFVFDMSKSILGATYQGVAMTVNNGTVNVFDGTTAPNKTGFLFTDLIGQATWIGFNTISVKTVMRADISVGDQVTLPKGQIATTAQSLSQFRQGSVFQGNFLTTEIRHIGNFRMPSGDAWCTVFNLVGPVQSNG